MRCPTLSELPPPPPPGKACTEHGQSAGWPWTEKSPQLPATMPSGEPWPRVSIVTPSYNQGQFIEETIRSVLLQGYPNLEYIIIDGASTDNSVEVIKKYAPWLAYWISEPDKGQADAIGKGFAHATGDIVAYLNSDDVYLPDAIETAVSAFLVDSETSLVHGDLLLIDSTSRQVGQKHGLEGDFLKFFLKLTNPILQPSAFMRQSALEAVGGIDPSFHMAMDYDLWCRIGLRGMEIEHIPTNLSLFRIHRESKTRKNVLKFAQERWRMVEKYLADPDLAFLLATYRNRLYAVAHMHLAGAYWLRGEGQSARAHYRQAVRMAPRLALSRQGLSLFARFLLKRRSFRGRFVEHVE